MNDSIWKNIKDTFLKFEHYLEARGDREIQRGTFSKTQYIDLIRSVLDFYLPHQQDSGALIDPEFQKEWHYSTPCFALAAAFLASQGETRYLEPAVRAMKWASRSLAEQRCPQDHPNFFPIPLMTAHDLIKDLAGRKDLAQWSADLSSIDPWTHYKGNKRESGQMLHNWNAMVLAGEYRRYKAGFSNDTSFIDEHIAFHIERLSEIGWYKDGDLSPGNLAHPTAYDLVGRAVLIDLVDQGWDGAGAVEIEEALLKGVMTQLFFQEPNGAYQCIGRSAHHIWNEACLAQCAEWGARAYRYTCPSLAGALRRQAQLALSAMRPWQSEEGRFYILKNRFAPEERQGFEGYSISTTYNMWALIALVNAALLADDTIEPTEIPSEHFSYGIHTGKDFHMIALASQGYFGIVDTCGDPATNPTGLLRIAKKGCPVEMGPSEGSVERPRYTVLGKKEFLAHSPSWQDRLGDRHDLAGIVAKGLLFDQPGPYAPMIRISPGEASVQLDLHWQGGFWGAGSIATTIRIDASGLTIGHRVKGKVQGLEANIPLFYSDGIEIAEIRLEADTIELRYRGELLTVESLQGKALRVDDTVIGSRIGFLKRAVLSGVPGEDELSYRISIIEV